MIQERLMLKCPCGHNVFLMGKNPIEGLVDASKPLKFKDVVYEANSYCLSEGWLLLSAQRKEGESIEESVARSDREHNQVESIEGFAFSCSFCEQFFWYSTSMRMTMRCTATQVLVVHLVLESGAPAMIYGRLLMLRTFIIKTITLLFNEVFRLGLRGENVS